MLTVCRGEKNCSPISLSPLFSVISPPSLGLNLPQLTSLSFVFLTVCRGEKNVDFSSTSVSLFPVFSPYPPSLRLCCRVNCVQRREEERSSPVSLSLHQFLFSLLISSSSLFSWAKSSPTYTLFSLPLLCAEERRVCRVLFFLFLFSFSLVLPLSHFHPLFHFLQIHFLRFVLGVRLSVVLFPPRLRPPLPPPLRSSASFSNVFISSYCLHFFSVISFVLLQYLNILKEKENS